VAGDEAKAAVTTRLPSRPGSIPFIEVARSVAPLIVLWVHVGIANGYNVLPYAAIIKGLRLLDNGAHVGVLLFFLVSGFIISHVATLETRREFLVKRIFRIVPMLFFGVTVAYLTSSTLLRWGLPPIGQARSLSDLLFSIFLLDWFFSTPYTLAVTWTLVSEVSFYGLMFIAYRSLAASPVVGTILLIAIVAVLELLLVLVLGGEVSAVFYFMQVEFIFVGRAAYLYFSGRASLLAALALAGFALLTLIGLHTTTAYSRSLLLSENSVIYSWATTIAIFCLMYKFVTFCPRPLRFLSNISYSVYLLHFSIGTAVFEVIRASYGVPTGWAFWAALVATLGCAYLTYRAIELPCQTLGRRILTSQLRRPALAQVGGIGSVRAGAPD
jgi:exopolysaccharide production protein ExoZ